MATKRGFASPTRSAEIPLRKGSALYGSSKGRKTMASNGGPIAETDHLEQAAATDADAGGVRRSAASVADLLRGFLAVQQRRAEAYSMLRRGFSEYMTNGGELAYQQLCGNITAEFNDCSKQVLEMISLLSMPEFCRDDLADLLKVVQAHEKEKLHLTAKIQVLRKAGHPSERPVSHEDCRSRSMAQHVCVHVKEITEAAGTEDAEADAEYDAALKEAIQGVEEAVTNINEHMEEVRYEIEALEAEPVGSK